MMMSAKERQTRKRYEVGCTEKGVRSHKLCRDCNTLLQATNEFFNRDNGSRDGLTTYCKKCCCQRSREQRERLLEDAKEQTYCVVDLKSQILKIGRTNRTIPVRLQELRCGNKHLTPLIVFDGDCEFQLRRSLVDYRVNGDSYRLTPTTERLVLNAKFHESEEPVERTAQQLYLFEKETG